MDLTVDSKPLPKKRERRTMQRSIPFMEMSRSSTSHFDQLTSAS